MEDMNHLLNLPSPTTSLQYVYGADGEQYLDTTSSFDSQSGSNSPYDMSEYSPELGLPGSYDSPDGDGEVGEPAAGSSSQGKPAPKRKRENRYKNASPSVLSRRRAQNRQSQRAYRERKDAKIRELENALREAKDRNEVLTQAYAAMHAEYVSLKSSQLKEQAYHQAELSFDPSATMAGNERLDVDDLFVYSDMTGTYNL